MSQVSQGNVAAFLEMIGRLRDKSVALSPLEVSVIIGVNQVEFESEAGEWHLANSTFQSVVYELWLHQRRGKRTAELWISDVRFNFNECRSVLNGVLGPFASLKSRAGPGISAVYNSTDTQRQAVFIFDGSENDLFLSMIVVS